eukprot:472634_1
MGAFCFGQASINTETENEEDILFRQQRAQKRAEAVKELISTEKTYVEGLQLCIHAYLNGLSQNKKIIATKDLKIIFSDIEMICKLNQTFLDDLQSRYISFNNHKTMIGDRFIEFTPYFKMYQNYCNNYVNANILLEKYNNKKSFINYCNEAKQRCSNKTLQSLLITPIQRLPRYRLCLSEIIKNTEYNHSDLKHLNHALELVEETTNLINDRMKEFQSRQDVRSIQARFSSTVSLIKPHRKFIKEGMLTRVDKNGKDHKYTFFLFNDILCYASGNIDALKMHCMLSLDDGAFAIKDIAVAVNERYKNTAFEIHSSVKSFVVYCDTFKMKKKWMGKINEILSFNRQNKPRKVSVAKYMEQKESAPLMIPSDWSDVCQVMDCGTKFTFINRKSHCKYCGILVCSKCSNKLASKTNKELVVKPVCKVCFNKYKNKYPAKENGKLQDDSYLSADETD